VGHLDDLLPLLVTLHEDRMKQDSDFKSLQQDIAEFKEQRQKNLISLNEAERRKERDAHEARLALRETKSDEGKVDHRGNLDGGKAVAKVRGYRDDGLQADERNLANELELEKAQKDARDVVLIEASRVLGDEVARVKVDVRFATRVRTVPAPLPE
jgi:carboxyl-terminal processing protease